MIENINEIKKQYPSLQKWSDTHAWGLYKKIQEHQLITEFLSTVSPSKTLPQVLKQIEWFGHLTSGKTHQDFFAGRVTSYAKSTADWDDL